MANVFTNTLGCKAVWRFESGLLINDSQNSNTLVNTGVTADGTNYKEGADSALFDGSSYLYINNADLISGFPLRSDDITKKFSFTLWIRPNGTAHYTIFSKSNPAGTTLCELYTYNGYLYFHWYSGGDETWQVCNITDLHWYHLGVTGDAVAKTAHIRVWDVTSAIVSNYNHTYGVSIALDTTPFVIGARSASYFTKFTGNIDELVAFNFELSDADIDAIRNGTYTAPTTAVVGSVAVAVDGQGVSGGQAPLSTAIIGSVGVAIGSSSVIGGVTPHAVAVIGSVAVNIGSNSVIVSKGPAYLAQVVGSVGVVIGGEGVTSVTIPGVLAVVGSVGVVVAAKGVISKPHTTVLVGSVAIRIGSEGVITGAFPTPSPVLLVVGSVGIAVGSEGVVGFVLPPVLPVVGSVGITIGQFRVPELTVVEFISPTDLTLAAITGSVGVEVGGASVVTTTIPPVYAVPVPQVAEDATIFVGVRGVIAFIHPQILEVIGDAEVFIGGTPIAGGTFDTYALTGARGEPSIYSGFNFNSYARYRGQYFGAGEDGIYLLEGEDDAGVEIHSGVRIGPWNAGTDREKRLRLLRCGGKSTGAQVKVSNGNGSAGYYDVEDGRAAVSREVQGREITIEIADFETLDHLEIVPLVLHKR